jgi:hypothetical protein
MPRDGQTIPDDTVILPDLLALPAAAVALPRRFWRRRRSVCAPS